MNIQWHEVTWYSKVAAVVVLLVVVPIITFFIGRQYEDTILTINNTPQQVEEFSASGAVLNPDQSGIATTSINGSSGIQGMVTIGPDCTPIQKTSKTCTDKPYVAQLIIKDNNGKLVTNTVSGKDGQFSVVLPPGTYTVSPAKTPTTGPSGKISSVTVTNGVFIQVNINFVPNTK